MSHLVAHIDLLGRMLNASRMRHEAVGHNLANVNTPGYKRLEVAFEDALRAELNAPHQDATGLAAPVIRRQTGLSERADGNNVDIDMEVGALTRNAMLYQTYTEILATQLAQMRAAITTR